MSGGGVKGAYEAGVLYGMYNAEQTDKSKFAYDIVSGVSAGSINAGALSMFAKGDEGNTFKILSDTWANAVSGNIYKNWWPF
jgi:predicted acylesterase/phospholipase RssA